MELYRQQMVSVKDQHTQACQDLIPGLQELDHRVQQGLERRDIFSEMSALLNLLHFLYSSRGILGKAAL